MAAELPEPLLINDHQAAALAGISRGTWCRLRAAGKLPLAIKLGGSVRWRRDEIERWIAAGCPCAAEWAAMTAAANRKLRVG
jgi:excisionase family DNA binding protein